MNIDDIKQNLMLYINKPLDIQSAKKLIEIIDTLESLYLEEKSIIKKINDDTMNKLMHNLIEDIGKSKGINLMQKLELQIIFKFMKIILIIILLNIIDDNIIKDDNEYNYNMNVELALSYDPSINKYFNNITKFYNQIKHNDNIKYINNIINFFINHIFNSNSPISQLFSIDTSFSKIFNKIFSKNSNNGFNAKLLETRKNLINIQGAVLLDKLKSIIPESNIDLINDLLDITNKKLGALTTVIETNILEGNVEKDSMDQYNIASQPSSLPTSFLSSTESLSPTKSPPATPFSSSTASPPAAESLPATAPTKGKGKGPKGKGKGEMDGSDRKYLKYKSKYLKLKNNNLI